MTEAEKESPFRKPGFVLAGGFLAVIVVLALIMVFTGASDGKPDNPPVASSATPQAPAAGGCRPTDTDRTIPAVTPKGVTWSLFHMVAVPMSSTAGPLVAQGDVARCYAHTPAGALIAASQITVRLSMSDDWRAVTDHQVEASPSRDVYLKLRAQITAPSPDAGGAGQLAGFKFVTYTPQTAVIELVLRGPSGGMTASAFTVAWDGDWKLHLQPDGTLTNSQHDVTSIDDGYVTWAGV